VCWVCGWAPRAFTLEGGWPEEPDPDRQGERADARGDGGAPVRDRYPETQGRYRCVLDAPDGSGRCVRAGFSRHDAQIQAKPQPVDQHLRIRDARPGGSEGFHTTFTADHRASTLRAMRVAGRLAYGLKATTRALHI
jgi:hypothetical protein